MIKGVIFDLDGTLSDSVNLTKQVRSPWEIISSVQNKSKLSLRFKADNFDVGLNQVIAELINNQILVAVISRSPSAYTSTMLSFLGVDFIFFRAGGKESPEQRLKSAIRELNLLPNEVLYIADTIEDYEVAQVNGCRYEFAFWNGDQRPTFGNWVELLPKSSTLEYLYLRHFHGVAKPPRRNLDLVVNRFYKDYISAGDLAWLRDSEYEFWKHLLLTELGEWDSTFADFCAEIWSRSDRGEQGEAPLLAVRDSIQKDDWARMLLYGRSAIVAYKQAYNFDLEKRFSSISHNLSSKGSISASSETDEYPYAITGSVLAILANYGLVANPPKNLLLVQNREVTYRLKEIVKNNSRWGAPKTYASVENSDLSSVSYLGNAKPKIPPTNYVGTPNHYNIFGNSSNVDYLLRHNYEFDQKALMRLFASSVLPNPVDCTSLYGEHSKQLGDSKIFSFLPYSSSSKVSGRIYWRWIKDWKQISGSYKSSSSIHLHYLELISLSIARFVWVSDPMGRNPIIAMPCSDISEDQPGGISRRLAHRVGQLLGRKVHYILDKSGSGIVKKPKTPIAFNSGVLIDDQITMGTTYVQAINALGFAPNLITWSSSKLTDEVVSKTLSEFEN